MDQHWKLVANKDSSYHELYDLAADPYEKRDLKEQKPEVAEGLLKEIAQWKASLPAKPSKKLFSAERSRKDRDSGL